MSSTTFNFSTRRDEKFDNLEASGYKNTNPRSLPAVGYTQIENSGSQAVLSLVRVQLTNDTLGTNSVLSELVWNPVNDRFNFIDANVGDYIDLNVVLNITTVGLIQVSIELDFSPALDGSQTVSAKVTRLVVPTGGTDSLFFNFKFVLTDDMKTNGIGAMATPFGAYTLDNTMFNVERTIRQSVN